MDPPLRHCFRCSCRYLLSTRDSNLARSHPYRTNPHHGAHSSTTSYSSMKGMRPPHRTTCLRRDSLGYPPIHSSRFRRTPNCDLVLRQNRRHNLPHHHFPSVLGFLPRRHK